MIDVKNLNKTYGEKAAAAQVLKHVSFSLEKGCFCSIVGPSGSGKSTLLNILGGLETADSGMITVDGAPVCGLSSRQELKYRREYLGFIFQFYNLIPNLTAYENIKVCEDLSSDSLDLEELMKQLGIWEHRNKFPSQLSGGQQQRCAIARALVKNPKILLCDEPTGALDSTNTKDIMCILKEINEKYSTTILIVTHNDLICETSDRILRLVDGEIVQDQRNDHPKKPEDIDWTDSEGVR